MISSNKPLLNLNDEESQNDPFGVGMTPRAAADPKRSGKHSQNYEEYSKLEYPVHDTGHLPLKSKQPYFHESTPIGETVVGQLAGSGFGDWSSHNVPVGDDTSPLYSSALESSTMVSPDQPSRWVPHAAHKDSDHHSPLLLQSPAGQSNSQSLSSGAGRHPQAQTGSRVNSVQGLYGDSANLRDSEVSEDSNFSNSGYAVSIGRRGGVIASANEQQRPVTILPRRYQTMTSLKSNQNLIKHAIETKLLHKVHNNHAESNLRFQPTNPIWRDQDTGRIRSQSVRTESAISSDAHSLSGQPHQPGGKKQPSRVVYIKGVDFERVSLGSLVGLCQCFGRVEVGMAHLAKEYALVKFYSVADAKYCIKELYGKTIGAKSLLLHYSGFDEIKTKGNSAEKIYFTPNNIPIEQEKSLTVGHIAKTLLITIYSRSNYILTFEELQSHFERELANCRSHPGVLPNQIFVEFPTLKGAISFALSHNRSQLYNGSVQILVNFSSRYKFF